jgi:hypothetical protein
LWWSRRRFLYAPLVGLVASLVPALDFKPMNEAVKEAEPLAVLTSPNDLVLLAVADARTLPPGAVYYTRWLAIQDGEMKSARTASLALNYACRGSVIQKPLIVANGKLLRVDLTLWFPQGMDRAEGLRIWEEFQYDPMFSLLVTKDTLNFLGPDALRGLTRRVKVPGAWREETVHVYHPGGDFHYHDDTGRVLKKLAPGRYEATYKFKQPDRVVEEQVKPGEDDVVRLDAGHIDPNAWHELKALTHSEAPLVDHRYFKYRALRTIQENGLYRKVFGGLYYQLHGIRRAKDVFGKDTKVTDLDLYFDNNLGVGNVKAGLTAEELFDRLRSDQRVAIAQSKVTDSPREVLLLPVLDARPGDVQPAGSITGDIKDKNIDIGQRAFANLLKPFRAARESIFPGRNGLPEYGAWSGDGALQDEVPFDVAQDTTIPGHHHKRLEAAISCLRCHNAEGSDGWKPAPNDVQQLVAGRPAGYDRKKPDRYKGSLRLDIAGDLGVSPYLFDPDTADRLAARYAGNFDKAVRRARDDLAELTLRCTGPWPGGGDQADICRLVYTRLADEYAAYIYTPVDARQVLLECGFSVPTGKAPALLHQLCPPDGRSEIPGLIPEDPRIALLKSGIGVNRSDAALAFNYICERVHRQVRKNIAEGKRWYGDN